MIRSFRIVATFLLLPVAVAHEGNEHLDESVPASGTAAPPHAAAPSNTRASRFEIVLATPDTLAADIPMPVRILVADADTNAPITGASVALEISGVVHAGAEAVESDSGIYVAELPPLPPGNFDIVVVVDLEGAVERMSMPTLSLLEQASMDASVPLQPPARRRPSRIPTVGALLVIIAMPVFLWRLARRGRRLVPEVTGASR